MVQLSYVAKFLDTISSSAVYVEPIEAGLRGDFKDVVFRINGEYFLHILMGLDNNIYPIIIQPLEDSVSHIKFTYEGSVMEDFFNEIKIDIENLF